MWLIRNEIALRHFGHNLVKFGGDEMPDSMQMYRLIYLSTARDDLRWADIDAICTVSRENNEEAGLTGLLLYDGSRFRQVLEGEYLAVLAVMERIMADPRHRGVTVTWEGMVERRAFADWTMACQEVTTLDDGRSFAEKITELSNTVQDPALAGALQAYGRSGFDRDLASVPPAWMTGQATPAGLGASLLHEEPAAFAAHSRDSDGER